MEQYLNLVWKNYTASFSRNTDENFFDEDDDASEVFVNNDLHYKIPFWIGVIVISLLLLSAIIAAIRYCIYTLCSSHTETEKVALMPPKSPCLSPSAVHTIQRQRHRPIPHHLSDDNETSSSSPRQSRDQHSDLSIISIIRQHSRPHFTPTRRDYIQNDTDKIMNHYFSASQLTSSQTPVDFRKKVHDIYVLPVSPALSSSSSSTTNTAEMMKPTSNTMPIRSQRYLLSSASIHNDSTYHGVKNHCFADSPQPKNRTLPRSHAGTLKRIQPPSQPPPLPPTISPIQHQLSITDLNPDTITLRSNRMTKTLPPPVPYRSQKPAVLTIGFEELTKQSDKIGFRVMTGEPSPQNDSSEHSWPNPPESMSTSQISGPLSIPYDHLIPTVIMHQNNPTTFFLHQYRHVEHSMLTESET